jgi:hypothetical protein
VFTLIHNNASAVLRDAIGLAYLTGQRQQTHSA